MGMSLTHGSWLIGAAGALCAHLALAQTTLSAPEPPFNGKIGFSAKDSVPDWPQAVTAPAGAPNIIVILLDDVGFGAASTFGGPVETPHARSAGREGTALQPLPRHRRVLADPGRIVDRTQRSSGGLRYRDERTSWVSRL